nr:MAG TPA: InsA C-terminal domain [Caudoviricetes sp.]
MDNQKEKIRAEYENGAGAKELAEKYNIKDSTIRVWAKRYKWNKKKQCNAIKKKHNNVTLQKKETLHVTKESVTESQKRNIVEKVINEEEKLFRSK